MKRRPSKPNTYRAVCQCSDWDDGFALVDLLVAIGIVGVLAALMLPSVLGAIEAGRRTQCTSNLRQFGLALQNYTSTFGWYPPDTGILFPEPCGPSWHVRLLPYLGQRELFDRHNSAIWSYDFRPDGGGPPQFEDGRDSTAVCIATFICPSDSTAIGMARTNYRVSLGAGPAVPGSRPRRVRGVFIRPGGRTPRDVTDGLQNTVLVSERCVGAQERNRYDPSRDLWFSNFEFADGKEADSWVVGCSMLPKGKLQFYSALGTTWHVAGTRSTLYNHVLGPNASIPDCTKNQTEGNWAIAMTARSLHPGVVNVLKGDGAVQPVGESIDLAVWRAFATIAAGD